MKIKIILILLILGESLIAQQSISVEYLLEKAKNYKLIANQKSAQSDIFTKQTSLANKTYLPQSTLTGRASWQSEVTSLPINLPGIEVPELPQDQYKVALDVNQMLWDGGRSARQKDLLTQRNNLEMINLELKQSEINQLIINQFLQVTLAEKLIKTLNLNLLELDNNIERVNAAIENGISIPQDLHMLEIHRIKLVSNKEKQEASKLAALENIALWTELSLDELLEAQFDDSAVNPASNNQRKELNLLDAQSSLVELNKNMAFAQNMPVIAAFVNLGYGRPGLNFLSPDFEFYGIFGVQLSIPLTNYYTGKNKLDRQIASLQQSKISVQKELLTHQIKTQSTQLESQIDYTENLIIHDNEIIEYWKDIIKTSNIQWENGEKSTMDYLNEVNKKDLAIQEKIIHETQLTNLIFQQRILNGQY